MFGDSAVFKELFDAAKKLGISIILEGVFSHTESDSIYFNKYDNYPGVGAYQSIDFSPYFGWYEFKTNCEDYQCWWGGDTLPEVNEMNPFYRQFIFGGWMLPMNFLRVYSGSSACNEEYSS